MVEKVQEDPFRADAARVYRAMRDFGQCDAVELADRCFGAPPEGPASSMKAIQKAFVRRVLNSIVWMRHHGVSIWAVPAPTGTFFSLEPMKFDALSVSARSAKTLVTDEVAQSPADAPSDVMGLWHGG